MKVSRKYHIRRKGPGKLKVRHNPKKRYATDEEDVDTYICAIHGKFIGIKCPICGQDMTWVTKSGEKIKTNKRDWIDPHYCKKCENDTIHKTEDLMDVRGDREYYWGRGWTCLKCGNVDESEGYDENDYDRE